MLELKNVSTYRLLNTLSVSYDERKIKLFNALINHKIYDYQRLSKFIEFKPVKDLDYRYLTTFLNRVITKVSNANELGIEPKLYPTKGYTDKFLEHTDEDVKIGNLIINNFLIRKSSALQVANSSCSIAEIKHLLSHTTPTGENASSYLIGVGSSIPKKLQNSVEFYEQQVERQANDALFRNVNLFDYDSFEKEFAFLDTPDPIYEILEYILDSGYSMGKPISEPLKNEIKSVIDKAKNGQHDYRLVRILGIIRDYVTLGEIQHGLIKTKAINRFVK